MLIDLNIFAFVFDMSDWFTPSKILFLSSGQNTTENTKKKKMKRN
jgi:hypothetical protein